MNFNVPTVKSTMFSAITAGLGYVAYNVDQKTFLITAIAGLALSIFGPDYLIQGKALTVAGCTGAQESMAKSTFHWTIAYAIFALHEYDHLTVHAHHRHGPFAIHVALTGFAFGIAIHRIYQEVILGVEHKTLKSCH